MRKLVPFKKDINFDTNVAVINSISLEHEIKTFENNLLIGKFIISGDYKMTDTSPNLDTFEYELPFNINIDKKYDTASSTVDINDFYYEVINNRVLSVNIELAIDGILEREVSMAREVEEEVSSFEEVKEEALETVNETVETEELETEEDRDLSNVKSLFDDLDENDKYVIYKIHIVTENDTLESIANDYEVTKEDLTIYNDLSEIKIGDKLIIPANES